MVERFKMLNLDSILINWADINKIKESIEIKIEEDDIFKSKWYEWSNNVCLDI